MPRFCSEYSSHKAFDRLARRNDDGTEDTIYDIQFLYNFMDELCDSENLAAQLAYIRGFPETTRNFLKDIIFGNELYVAYIHVMFHGAKSLWAMMMSLGPPPPITTVSDFPACTVFLHYLES